MAAAILAASCRGERAQPATSREPLIVWRQVGSWSGRSTVQTESFISETGLFRVHWEARADEPDDKDQLRVTLHSAVSGRSLVLAVDHRGAGRDSAQVSEDPREFFLVVEGKGLDWTVTLDEGIRATGPNASTP